MEEKGMIEIGRNLDPEYYSWIVLVPKAGNRWIPVINLLTLNSYIPCPTFKMKTAGFILG